MTTASKTPVLSPPELAREWPYPALVFALLVAIYAHTAPSTVAFEDDGGFIMAADLLGIAHPPGYPLWTLLGKLSTWIPFGTIAFRVHLLSGLLGAATCAVLWWIARTLTADRQAATVVSLAYGLSPVMWSQSLIAEVYTLNTLLYFALFALALQLLHAGDRRLLLPMGVVYGLGLCNHMPLIVLGTPCLVFILWPMRREIIRGLPAALLGVAIGLLPYAWMVVRSRAEPAISFYGPIRSFDEFVYYVSRKGYERLDQRASAGTTDKINFMLFVARESIRQFGIAGALVALIGLGRQLRDSRVSWNLGMLAGFASGGFVVASMLRREYHFIEQMIFRVYPLATYGILAIWLAVGLAWLRGRARDRFGAAGGWAIVAFGFCLVGFNLGSNYAVNDRGDFRFADEYARGVLESLEPHAILFTETDADVFPMGYLNLVEGVRPDVDLYHYEGLIFEPRLFHALDGTRESRREHARALIRSTDRPVYFMLNRDLGYDLEDFGFYVKIDRSRPRGETHSRVSPELLALALRLNEQHDLVDPWSRMKRDAVLANYARLLEQVIDERPDDPRVARYREVLDAISTDFLPALNRIRTRIALADARGEEAATAENLEALARIEDRIDHTTSRRHIALYYATRGALLSALERDAEAEASLIASLRAWWDPRNEAYMEILALYARQGEREQYRSWRSKLMLGAPSEELMRLDRKMGY